MKYRGECRNLLPIPRVCSQGFKKIPDASIEDVVAEEEFDGPPVARLQAVGDV